MPISSFSICSFKIEYIFICSKGSFQYILSFTTRQIQNIHQKTYGYLRKDIRFAWQSFLIVFGKTIRKLLRSDKACDKDEPIHVSLWMDSRTSLWEDWRVQVLVTTDGIQLKKSLIPNQRAPMSGKLLYLWIISIFIINKNGNRKWVLRRKIYILYFFMPTGHS